MYPSCQHVVALAKVECDPPPGSITFEPDERVKQKWGAHTESSELNNKRWLWVLLDNATGFTINIEAEKVLGSAAGGSCNPEPGRASTPQEKVLTVRVSSEEVFEHLMQQVISGLNTENGLRIH